MTERINAALKVVLNILLITLLVRKLLEPKKNEQ